MGNPESATELGVLKKYIVTELSVKVSTIQKQHFVMIFHAILAFHQHWFYIIRVLFLNALPICQTSFCYGYKAPKLFCI